MKNTALIKSRLFIITLFSTLLLITSPLHAMTSMDGRAVQITSLVGQGKWSVFKVWAADCHICQKTIHYLGDFKRAYPEADVYGISVDGQAGKKAAKRFIANHKLQFMNLLSDGTEMDDFLYANAGETLLGTPTMIVFNPKGEIAAVQPGPVTADDLIDFIKREESR